MMTEDGVGFVTFCSQAILLKYKCIEFEEPPMAKMYLRGSDNSDFSYILYI